MPRTSVQRAPKPNSGWALSPVDHRRRTEHCGLLRASKRAAPKTGTPSGHPHFSGVHSQSPQSGRGRQVPRFLVNNARDVRLTVPDCVTTACDSQPNMVQYSRPIGGPGSIEVDDVKTPVQRPCVGYTLSYVEENIMDKAFLIVAFPRSRALLSPLFIPILRERNL